MKELRGLVHRIQMCGMLTEHKSFRSLIYVLLLCVHLVFIQTGQAQVCADILSNQDSDYKFSAKVVSPQNLIRPKQIRVMSYNVQNLYVGKDEEDMNPEDYNRVKNESHTQEIAYIIKDADPDFLILQEVQTPRALDRFVEQYLDNSYVPYLTGGGGNRLMNTVLLVKDNLNFTVQARATDQHQWYAPSGELEPVFSRELGYFIIKDGETNEPAFVLFGVHLKSAHDRKNDPDSNQKRTHEAKMMSTVVRRFSKRNPQLPFLILGDFNAEPEAEELSSIMDLELLTPLRDEKTFKNEAGYGRFTHSFHPEGVGVTYLELDYILASPHLQDQILSADVYRYKDFKTGLMRPIPETYKQRSKNPSDHFPIFIDLLIDPETKP